MDPLVMKNRRIQLGDCFRHIKFSSMPPSHISQCLSKYQDLFQRDELLEIITIQSSYSSITLKAFDRKHGSRNIRQWKWNPSLRFSIIYPREGKDFELNKSELTVFQANKKLLYLVPLQPHQVIINERMKT